MTSQQLAIESYKKQIRSLQGDLDNTKLALQSKERMLDIQKQKCSQLEEQNKYLRTKTLGDSFQPSGQKQSVDQLRSKFSDKLENVKKQLKLKDDIINDKNLQIEKLTQALAYKEGEVKENETKHQQLAQKYNTLKEDYERINLKGGQVSDSIDISNILMSQETKNNDLDFSFPSELKQVSEIKQKINHQVEVDSSVTQVNPMQKKKDPVFQANAVQNSARNYSTPPASLVLQHIEDEAGIQTSQQESNSRKSSSVNDRVFKGILGELSILPIEKQRRLLNKVSIWSEMRMEELSQAE